MTDSQNTSARHLYNDQWGAIIDYPGGGYIEIRWYDTTADMTGDAFNAWLTTFVEQIEATGRTKVIVDSVQFKMPMERMSMGWRDEHIVPRYNKVGVTHFAFHMPAGMPAIGAPPAQEGPADYHTAYFATRTDALRWLAS